MRVQLGNMGIFYVSFSMMLPLFALGCGSDGGANSAGGDALFTQAPHCPTGTDALKVEGSIAGGAIADTRSANINAGLENFGTGRFYTPLTNLAPLADNQLTLTLEWTESLAYGDHSSTTGGKLTLPMLHPSAGSQFCVSRAEVGFVDGGSEDGVFKFAITEVKAGANCSGAAETVELRGCFE